MFEMPNPSTICELQNIGPNRITHTFSPLERRCLFLFAATNIEEITDTGESGPARMICNAVASQAAADGYPDGYVSRLTEKGERTRCIRFPDLDTGLEYTAPEEKDAHSILGAVVAITEAATDIPEGLIIGLTPEQIPVPRTSEQE